MIPANDLPDFRVKDYEFDKALRMRLDALTPKEFKAYSSFLQTLIVVRMIYEQRDPSALLCSFGQSFRAWHCLCMANNFLERFEPLNMYYHEMKHDLVDHHGIQDSVNLLMGGPKQARQEWFSEDSGSLMPNNPNDPKQAREYTKRLPRMYREELFETVYDTLEKKWPAKYNAPAVLSLFRSSFYSPSQIKKCEKFCEDARKGTLTRDTGYDR